MDDLEELRTAILNKYSGLNATELPISQIVPVGSDGIQRGIGAIIPDNDACYLWTETQTFNNYIFTKSTLRRDEIVKGRFYFC